MRLCPDPKKVVGAKIDLRTARYWALLAQSLGIEGPCINESQNFFGEGDIYLLALRYIYRHPGCTTTDIRKYFKQILVLSNEDNMPLEGRSDSRIDQIIRNLVSHRTLERYGYAVRQDGRWFITQKGKRVLSVLGWA